MLSPRICRGTIAMSTMLSLSIMYLSHFRFVASTSLCDGFFCRCSSGQSAVADAVTEWPIVS